jgi:Tyrosine-protein kinase ephrin type A/B receptor-like
MSQYVVLFAIIAVVLFQLSQAQQMPVDPMPSDDDSPIDFVTDPISQNNAPLSLCPAGFFANLLTCKPCPRGMTSLAGVMCIPCPLGSYAPSAGSPMCYACAAGYVSAPAGEACYQQAAPKKGGGKRRLRDESDLDSEIEVELEAESIFSF